MLANFFKFLQIQKGCIKLIGVNLDQTYESASKWRKLWQYSFMFIFYLWTFGKCAHTILATHGVVELFNDVPVSILVLVTSVKMSILVLRSNRIRCLVENLDNVWNQVEGVEELYLFKSHKKDVFVTFLNLVFVIIENCLFTIIPLILHFVFPLRRNNIFNENIWTPFEPTASPYNEIRLLFYNPLAAIIFLSVTNGLDGLFFGVANNLAANFKILQHRVLNSDLKNDRSLIKLFQFHSKLLVNCKEFNDIFREAIFVDFFSTSASLCLVGYQLAFVNIILKYSPSKYKIIKLLISAQIRAFCQISLLLVRLQSRS